MQSNRVAILFQYRNLKPILLSSLQSVNSDISIISFKFVKSYALIVHGLRTEVLLSFLSKVFRGVNLKYMYIVINESHMWISFRWFVSVQNLNTDMP